MKGKRENGSQKMTEPFATNKKNILVAPLNWGLGHATRCIPIIRELENNGFTPILASDGDSLALLKKEFPQLTALELPSYQIEYAKNPKNLKWNLLKNSPKTIKAVFSEKRLTEKWISEYDLTGIISDNRLGVRSTKIPTVYITHQVTVLSGKTTWISSNIHQFFISKFNECWVPDVAEIENLSGKLGHLRNTKLNLKYIGILSRLEKKVVDLKYDVMVLLSGPEPQHTFLEEKLIDALKNTTQKVVFIKGKVEKEQVKEQIGTVTFYNFMQSEELEKTMNESKLVLSRSGYTTVMDLCKLEKNAFFIPTPGQFEQEYLAEKYSTEKWVAHSKQSEFKLEDLEKIQEYKGLPKIATTTNWKELFSVFKCE